MSAVVFGFFRLMHVIVISILMTLALPVLADEELKAIEEAQGVADLHVCSEEKLGVELLCNPQWKQDIDRDRAVMMVISQDPAVLLTVAKAKEAITGIEELTDDNLRQRGKYTEGFKTEQVTVGGLPAVQVEGFSEGFPETRLRDLYVVHDYQLYSFLFSVDPKEAWPDYVVLIGKIAESIKITDKQN